MFKFGIQNDCCVMVGVKSGLLLAYLRECSAFTFIFCWREMMRDLESHDQTSKTVVRMLDRNARYVKTICALNTNIFRVRRNSRAFAGMSLRRTDT